jgi:hypothetical protein
MNQEFYMSEDNLQDQTAEEIFNAFQYLSMMAIRKIGEVHAALPEGDAASCRIALQDIREILESMELAVEAIDQMHESEEVDQEDPDDIEDFLDEDFDDSDSDEI